MNDENLLQIDAVQAVETAKPLTLKRFLNKFLFWGALIGPDLLFATMMAVTLMATVVAVGGHVRFFQASLGLPIGIMAALIVYRSILKTLKRDYNPNIPVILRDWLPFLMVTFIYENLHDLSKHFYSYDIAGVLYNWDIAIFGVEPTLWAQKIYSPLLTDFMAFSYALYFVFPLIIMLFLSQDDRRFEFREMALALTFAFVMGFIGYVVWPCSPPRYFITELYTAPHLLHGPLLFDRLQKAWDGLSVVPCGAFPSLHVGISTVALIYAYKFRNFGKIYKGLWLVYIPMVASLWFSTVYLRHHWVIDIFAGWVVAIIAVFVSDHILEWWRKIRKGFGLSFQ